MRTFRHRHPMRARHRPPRQAGAIRAAAVLMLMSVLLLTPWLTGCHRDSAEQQVRAAVARAAEAVRDRDAGTVDDLLSTDLATPGHDLDRARLLGMLRLARLRNEPVRVLMGPVTVEPRGDRMLARFTVTLGGGGGLIPRRLGVYGVETAWRVEDGDWRCYSVTWSRGI